MFAVRSFLPRLNSGLSYASSRTFATKVKPGQKIFLFFFGAPGAGKGTYSKMLARDLKLNEISTGDELRAIIKGKSHGYDPAFVKEITEIVNSGRFVSDQIVLDIIKKKIDDSPNGVILDGFPRTRAQLIKYEESHPIHLVINLTLRSDILIEKLLGRRLCDKCGGNYNICHIDLDGYDMEPLLPTNCTKCTNGEFLKERADDTREIIEARLEEYEDKTKPLLEFFEQKKVLINFEAKKGVKDYPNILRQVKLALGL